MNLSSSATIFFFLLSVLLQQQPYINNMQLDCYEYSNLNATNGFACNGPQKSCNSYLTFQSHPPYNSASTIGSFLNAETSAIARINNISNVLETIPTNTQLIVPVNCSCAGGLFYQHNASYTLKTEYETYFTASNDTYQGLTTCQAMMKQNPYDSRHLSVGMNLLVPLRCACPSTKQSANGAKFLVAYMVTEVDYPELIAATFGVDTQSILDANRLPTADDLIFPYTALLVPLKKEPGKILVPYSPPPPPPLPQLQTNTLKPKSSSKDSCSLLSSPLWTFAVLHALPQPQQPSTSNS